MTHIELTIQDIEQRVEALMSLRDQLRGFMVPAPLMGKVVLAPALAPIAPVPATAKPKRTYTKRAVKPERQSPPPSPSNGDSGILNNPSTIGAVRRLAEPFGSAVLLSNGVFKETKDASNWLHRAKAKGWLVQAGRGLFKRTSSFGGQAEAAAPAAAPAFDKASRLELLKQRDAHLSANS